MVRDIHQCAVYPPRSLAFLFDPKVRYLDISAQACYQNYLHKWKCRLRSVLPCKERTGEAIYVF